MPSAVNARRPFRLDSKPWAMELGGAPQSNAHLTVPHVQYVGQDCAAQSYAQAVSSSQPTLQGEWGRAGGLPPLVLVLRARTLLRY